MKEMSRRDFIKNVAVGGAILGLGNSVFHPLRKPLQAERPILASAKVSISNVFPNW
ncbi:MAG: twin-arginine translocation signal domain-containing protein [Desulfobacteraceae bacterium]|nr:twin-arginine translocation signal domain-containing protein [Desulfobacteraceae bacterium]